jgi:hypothetical protein
VHVGELVSRKGQEVALSDARRIWYWKGANTLHEIAASGVGPGSKISVTAESVTLTQAIEIIVCTKAARKNLESASWA